MAWWVPWRTNCPRGLRASGIVGVMWGSVHFGQIASRPLRSTAHYLKETVMINHYILRVSYLQTNPIFVKTSHFVQIVHVWITENWVGYGTFWQIWQPSDLKHLETYERRNIGNNDNQQSEYQWWHWVSSEDDYAMCFWEWFGWYLRTRAGFVHGQLGLESA